MARASGQAVPPLLVWRERNEIDRLQEQRAALIERIGRLRPHSHARIALQTRLAEITARQLELTLKADGQ